MSEIEEVHKMCKWSDEEIVEELSRPVDEPLNLFQKTLERQTLCRILMYLTKKGDLEEPTTLRKELKKRGQLSPEIESQLKSIEEEELK